MLEEKELEVPPGAIHGGGRKGVGSDGPGGDVEDIAGGAGDGRAKLDSEVGRRRLGVCIDEGCCVLEPAVYRARAASIWLTLGRQCRRALPAPFAARTSRAPPPPCRRCPPR